jgi:hypothetical protein
MVAALAGPRLLLLAGPSVQLLPWARWLGGRPVTPLLALSCLPAAYAPKASACALADHSSAHILLLARHGHRKRGSSMVEDAVPRPMPPPAPAGSAVRIIVFYYGDADIIAQDPLRQQWVAGRFLGALRVASDVGAVRAALNLTP